MDYKEAKEKCCRHVTNDFYIVENNFTLTSPITGFNMDFYKGEFICWLEAFEVFTLVYKRDVVETLKKLSIKEPHQVTDNLPLIQCNHG